MSVRVLITGASGGIGSASAAALRARGARVIGLDLAADPAHDVLACDVRDQASVDAAVAEAIERLGGLDVLINNAGAYCMSKRGLVGYSDALRLEHGDAVTVTTVYPGYIRTAIHDASRERGVGLEGTRSSPAPRTRWCARRSAHRRATSRRRASGRSPTRSCAGSRAG
jgi:NAD(P)-dependent dehydrogenase (short-subunit alcohol dehydrogenase family)